MISSEEQLATSKSISEIVYAELNLEKWSIWEPASSKKTPQTRTFQRELTLSDGSTATAKVEIGFTSRGTLNTRDQKIYYVLLKLWEESGKVETPVAFSLQKIARLLGEEWSRHTHRSIVHSLLQLRGVLFVWEDSYFDKNADEYVERLDTFNILSELRIARRTRTQHVTTESCIFSFHPQLLASLKANHTTPLFLDTVLSFKSEIAQILYPRLDLLLSDKTQYERRTKELFEDLGLEGLTYKHPSARKRVIERALRELEGVCVTTGSILSARVEKTKDGTDYKIVIRKGPRTKSLAEGKPQNSESRPPTKKAEIRNPQGESGENDSAEIEASEEQSVTLIRYFHQQFHGGSGAAQPSAKEIGQAGRLIEEHGLEKVKHLVDFARDEAEKTKYQPASLNGILQYEGRALDNWDENARHKETLQKRRNQKEARQRDQEARRNEIVLTLCEMATRMQQEHPEVFAAFEEHVEAKKEALTRSPIFPKTPALQQTVLAEFDTQPRRLEMFVDFFQHQPSPLPELKQWLGEQNEAELKEILSNLN